MKSRLLSFLACLAVSATSGAALAQDDDAPETDTKEEAAGKDEQPAKKDEDFGHGRQFGLRAALVSGYRMILRYDESPRCRDPDPGDDEPTFCGNSAPLAIDLGLSFAPLDAIEPFLWARFGLASEDESAVAVDPIVYVGAGTRIYTMSDDAFKVYVEPAVALGLENGAVEIPLPTGQTLREEDDFKTDLLFHLVAGPELDLSQNLGFYADAGLTMGVLRSINATLELKAGLQGRLP